MLRPLASAPAFALAAACFAAPALAIQVCEPDGRPVNPSNGYTTEGKTGLMRCRSFAADGTQRREVRWTSVAGERPRRVTVLDQEFHETGKQVRERRWQPSERGAELVFEASWYLNGQPRERVEFASVDGKPVRRETSFHDNGKKSFKGTWGIEPGSGRRELATGSHQRFDSEGRLRGERIYDERGRIKRERELDERGSVARDDEVFEDGSRKAVGR